MARAKGAGVQPWRGFREPSPARVSSPGMRGHSADRRYNSLVITLVEKEEHLVEALRSLPPNIADQVIAWVTRLGDLGNGRSVNWSDTWTEEDLADARNASLSRFEDQEYRNA